MVKKISGVYIVALIPLIAVLFLHANLGSYTRFIADDFCAAHLGQRLGLLRYIWFWYRTWGGQFAALTADMVLAWSGTRGLWYVVGAALAIWSFGFVTLIYKLLPSSQAQRERFLTALTLGVTIVFTILLLTPYVPQAFYLFSAFRTHTLPLILFTVYVLGYVYFRSMPATRQMHWFFHGMSFLFALFNAGFSKSFTVLLILFFPLLAALEWGWFKTERRNQHVRFLLAGLAGALLAMLIMFLAPGNANRQQAFHQPSGLLEILSISISGYLAFLRQFFLAPEKICGLLGALLLFFTAGAVTPVKRKPQSVEIIALFALGLLFPFASFPPAAYGMGDFLPERAQTIPIFFLLILILPASFLSGNRWAVSSRAFPAAVLAAVLLISSASVNIQQLIESRHIFIEYAERMDKVEQQVLAAKQNGATVFYVPRLGNWARTFDPTDNPKFFTTACISMYYDIQILGPSIDE